MEACTQDALTKWFHLQIGNLVVGLQKKKNTKEPESQQTSWIIQMDFIYLFILTLQAQDLPFVAN